MMIEADGTKLADTNGGYYIHEINYLNGTHDGDAYYNFASNSGVKPNAARLANASGVNIKIRLKSTGADVTPDDAGGMPITVFKPWKIFKDANIGINHHYEIKNVNLSDCHPGEHVRIAATGGSTHSTYGSGNNTLGQEYQVSGENENATSSDVVDIIYNNPTEFGVKKSNGEALSSKKNVGGALSLDGQYADFSPKSCGIYTFEASTVVNNVYIKTFTIKAQNHGEEDIYLYSAEFVDATFVPHAIGDAISVSAYPQNLSDSDAAAISWKVAGYGDSTFTNSIAIGVNASAHNTVKPSVLIQSSDKRVPMIKADKNSVSDNITNCRSDQHSVIGCEFRANKTQYDSGHYFKYLKIGYIRDTGRTKYYSNSGVLTERPFKDKEIWYAHIPISVTIDAQASILVQDVDGDTIENATSIAIEGLIA